MIKLAKNTTDSVLKHTNSGIAFQPGEWQEATDELLKDDQMTTWITDENIIINNGDEDLPASVGCCHLLGGVLRVRKDISMIQGVGEFAPGVTILDNTIFALSVDIGDVFYGHKRIDNLIGEEVKFNFHLCCNNSDSNKWGQAKIRYKTTTGQLDKAMNSKDGEITIGPVQLPTTPYLIFCAETSIPTEYFSNNEKYLFISVERETPTEKDSPANPFLVLKYEIEYWKKVS